MFLHHFLLLLLVLLLTGPFEVAGKDQSRAGNPFVQSLVELVPVNEKLEFIEFRVWRKLFGSRGGCMGRAVARSRRLST
jgi:hypothetical protein